MVRYLLSWAACCVSISAALAQDEKPPEPKPANRPAEVKQQLAIAADNINRADISKTGKAIKPLETNDLIVVATAPEARVKAYADLAQKSYDLAFKSLNYEASDRLWPGKLTVYFFSEREEYNKYLRKVLQEKPEPKELVRTSLRGNEPSLIVTVPNMAKFTDAELQAEMAAAVAAALLKQKAGATMGTFDLPDWLTLGFGRAILNRLDGQSTRATTYKTKLRQIFAKTTKGPMPPKVNELWAAERPKEFEVLATALTEYFVFGPEANRFSKLLAGYKPSEERQSPNTDQALELLDLKWDALDTAWKAWIAKLK